MSRECARPIIGDVQVLLVGGEPRLLAMLRSSLGRVGISIAFARDLHEARPLLFALSSPVVLLAVSDDELRLSRESIGRWAPDARIVQVVDNNPHPEAQGPPPFAVDAWFSSPPRLSEVLDFVERFFSGRRVR